MSRGAGEVRIIAGRWRGRRLPVLASPGLRPTPDRVRETLFNWLAPSLPGARALDLFAGTGALGFEALSRGCAEVVMIDRTPAVARALRANAERLDAAGARVVQAEALDWLAAGAPASETVPFDLILLDPPYTADLLAPALGRIVAGGWLAPGGQVYCEQPRQTAWPIEPRDWIFHRERTAGQVRFGLLRAAPTAAADPPASAAD